MLVSRVFLGAVFSGQMMTLLYSLGGGLLCWLAMVGLRRLLTVKQLWLCSPLAAICHNLGQLLVAAGVMKTWAVLAYLLPGDRRSGGRTVYRAVRPIFDAAPGPAGVRRRRKTMEQKDIDRINELARLAKKRELTEEEKEERGKLRRAYIDSVKANLEGQLNNTWLQKPDGSRVKLEKRKD